MIFRRYKGWVSQKCVTPDCNTHGVISIHRARLAGTLSMDDFDLTNSAPSDTAAIVAGTWPTTIYSSS